MRLVFVRHGHPDYARDCLTELGRLQAEAAARRLQGEGVERIYSSTCGRALETAACLANRLGLTVQGCDFMREIRWGSRDGTPLFADGHPWDTADRLVSEGKTLLDPAWATGGAFAGNCVVEHVQRIAEETDAWLQALGFSREGCYYRVSGQPVCGTASVFGHGGASGAMLSHLFNLPFPFVCAAMGPDFTGVTIVQLDGAPGTLASPRFEVLNDARHILGLRADNVYGH